MILLLTNSYEQNVIKVMQELDKIEASYTRLNVDAFADEKISIDFVKKSDGLSIKNFNKINVVWERKAEVDVDREIIDNKFEDFALAETKILYQYITSRLSDRVWLNPVSLGSPANNKIIQLKIAQNVGLKIPKTIVTNDNKKLKNFIVSLGGLAIVKAMGSQVSLLKSQMTIDTSVIEVADLENKDECVSIAPILAQECIEKKYEIRATYISGELYCGAMDIRKSLVDERKQHSSAPWFNYELPKKTREKLIKFHNQLNLKFSCVDLIETTNGDIIFLESNPQGQYDFISQKCGLEINRRIAEKLNEFDSIL